LKQHILFKNNVGVIGKKRTDENEEEKLSVALLYRDGLGLKSAGMR
jgi:hypothetical protein